MTDLSHFSPRTISLLFLLLAIAINVTAETVLKSGTNQIGELELSVSGITRAFTTPAVVIGFGMAFVAGIFWTKVISREPLSWAVPLLSLSYIPLLFTSGTLLNEDISPLRILGVIVIIVGVALVFRS